MNIQITGHIQNKLGVERRERMRKGRKKGEKGDEKVITETLQLNESGGKIRLLLT